MQSGPNLLQGVQKYIYHRPGHGTGQNFTGHQAPYLALGDESVLEEGMMFSVEPGLMDLSVPNIHAALD